MIKTITLSVIGAGLVGTGAQTFTPQALQLTAGSISIEAGVQGVNINTVNQLDFSITIKAKDERAFTIRF